MPAKGTKSPRTKSPKTAKVDAGIAWESILTTSSVNQDNWNTFVCFLTPDRALNQIYVDLIEKGMQHGVRRRFDLISKRDFVEAIKKVEKQVKNAAKAVSTNTLVDSLNNSAFASAYEHAKTILDAGGEIDDHLWAKLIKCRILDLKKEVQIRTITKASSAQVIAAAPAKPEKGKGGGKKSPKPAASKKQTPAAPAPTADAHIDKPAGVKTRDQITDETKYVDDEPHDGPNQYIYLSGFYSIGLVHALDDVGIRIDTITNVSCDSLDETQQLFDEMIRRDRQEQTLKADVLKEIQKESITTPEQIAEQNQRNDQTIHNFWTNLMPILDSSPDQSMLQDVIVTTLKVMSDELPDSWINTEQRFRLADSLCDNIVDNSFRLNVRKRQFKTFNQQMKVVPIPTIEDKTAKSTSDAKIYNEMTTIIPPESISVPLILHGILEQVDAKLANSNTNSHLANPQDEVGRYLREKLMSLSMGKEQKKEIENLVPKSPFVKTTGSGPTMVYHSDEIRQRLITLNRLAVLDPIKLERHSLMTHSCLVTHPELAQKNSHRSRSKERQTRLNQFLQFCTDDELLPTDVDHILKQFVFECMLLNPMTENSTDQTTSRPSTAESEQEDEQVRHEKRLSSVNDEENKQLNNIHPIIWDDPFELLRTNEQTGRIGIATDAHPSSANSHSSRGSILRNRTESPKRPVYTVHFDVNNPDNNLQQHLSHILPPPGDVHVDGTIQAIIQHHKRNLNDWNFAEHFEPDIFVQVIEQALFTHSYVDVYYNRRDQTHMMVLSLPIPAGKIMGYENTSKKLFSDVGFRNFLDEISYEIVDWLRDEEAKYQADLLAHEVQTYIRQLTPTPDATKGAAGDAAGKKKKGAAGKKTPPARSRSTSVSSEAGNLTTEEEQAIRDDYAHPTSLKVWKQKRDKEIQEQELAKAKRAQSATKGGKTKSPRASEKAVKPSSPQDKHSKDGKTKQQTPAAPIENPVETTAPSESQEPVERFIGYSLGNHLLSAQCSTSHLLLPDGCFVRTRIDSLKRGPTCVSTSLYRNKSSYKVQLVNPNKPSNPNNQSDSAEHHHTDEANKLKDENSSTAIPDKRVAQYGVFTALLNSGMILSCSNYDTKAPKVEVPAPPPPPPPIEHPVAEVSVEEKKKDSHTTTKGKKKVKTIEVEAPPVEKPPPEPQYDAEPFQRLTISIPTGLVVTYYPETFLGVKPTQAHQLHRLVVKQYYACHSKGFHTCEQSRLNAYEETSRIIDGEGNVMIFKRNGELIILQPDGGIFTKTIVHPNEPEIEVATESPHTTKKGGRSDSRGKKKVDPKHGSDVTTVNEEVKPLVFEWKCVTSDGQVYTQNTTSHEYERIDQLRLILETNPKTTEQVIHREDKVVIVFRADGSRLVSFTDGTRITTYEALEQKNDSPNDQETGELHTSSSSFQRIPHVKIEAYGYATIAFNCQTTDCRTVFSDGSSIDVFSNGTYSIYESDGEKFDINDNGDILFDFQNSIYGKRVQELLSKIEPSKCIMSQNGDMIFDAVDYEQTQYCVESSGETYSKENDQQQVTKQFPLEMHVPRFFIVHEDGSGTELLRFKDLYSYLRTMDLDPSTAVVREPLSSNPKVTGATVMRPFQDEVHRRWLTTFDDDSIVPASLRSHTSVTAMTDSQDNGFFRQTDKSNQSSTFSTGFSNQQPILEMPKALDYRNFMEFPRLHDDIRYKVFNSLKTYIDFVTNRADYHTQLLPHDHRSRHEKEQANKIWKNARPQGTTKDDLALLYLKTVHPDRQKPSTTHQSVIPLAKKFNLTHLHEELHQEKLNKQLKYNMNKGIVIPYFQSEWGVAYSQQQQQQEETETPPIRESQSAGAKKTSNGNENSIRSPRNSPTDQQNRIAQIRKSQLTRSLSTEVADNNTMDSSGQHHQDGAYRPVKPFTSPRNNAQYDNYGNKRAHPVKIPNVLKGSRPNAQPHSRFLDLEEPVMVRPNNASIGAAALNNRPLKARRGCELFPDKIDFGVLKEGVTYGAEIDIKNVGIDACRFRIRQPPLGTGLRVVFQPGVLAAGMSRPLTIELYAIIKQNHNQQQQQQQQQSQGLYQLDQSIEIITETDIMHFPIRAKIASEEQFDIMFVNKDETAGMNKIVRLLARKSSNINEWLANTNKDSKNVTNE